MKNDSDQNDIKQNYTRQSNNQRNDIQQNYFLQNDTKQIGT